MDIGIAALSEVRRPDCGEIMAAGHTYYWSGRSDGYHSQGVAVAVSNLSLSLSLSLFFSPNPLIIVPVSEATGCICELLMFVVDMKYWIN